MHVYLYFVCVCAGIAVGLGVSAIAMWLDEQNAKQQPKGKHIIE